MTSEWDQNAVQQLIDEEVEESLDLDYKAAGAIGRTNKKKVEITKDVSAMANSNGGIIIYGIGERPDHRHLPGRVEPIDRTQFSKEWLEQIINAVRPRIDGLLVHPIPLESGPHDVVYVVQIPQSTTAHQARDWRYYKRFNFESVPMEDYEVRDVMNRVTTPKLAVEFGYKTLDIQTECHQYLLAVLIKNHGSQVVNNFQLEFTFPAIVGVLGHHTTGKHHVDVAQVDNGPLVVTYRSRGVLFPEQELDVGRGIQLAYQVDLDVLIRLSRVGREGRDASITWTLFADNMKPKHGVKPFSELHIF